MYSVTFWPQGSIKSQTSSTTIYPDIVSIGAYKSKVSTLTNHPTWYLIPQLSDLFLPFININAWPFVYKISPKGFKITSRNLLNTRSSTYTQLHHLVQFNLTKYQHRASPWQPIYTMEICCGIKCIKPSVHQCNSNLHLVISLLGFIKHVTDYDIYILQHKS